MTAEAFLDSRRSTSRTNSPIDSSPEPLDAGLVIETPTKGANRQSDEFHLSGTVSHLEGPSQAAPRLEFNELGSSFWSNDNKHSANVQITNGRILRTLNCNGQIHFCLKPPPIPNINPQFADAMSLSLGSFVPSADATDYPFCIIISGTSNDIPKHSSPMRCSLLSTA